MIAIKYLVTGGSGYVGNRLAKSIQNTGVGVICLKNRSNIEDSLPAESVDWCSRDSVEGLFGGVDCVVHVAASVHVRSKKGGYTSEADSDYILTRSLLENSVLNNVKKFVYISSIAVYGESCLEITDCSVLKPTNYYGNSKRQCEELCKEICKANGIALCIYRLPMVYGRSAPGSPSKITKLINYGLPLPFKAFSAKRTFVSIEKAVFEIERDLTKCVEDSFVAVLADDVDLSVLELASILSSYVGRGVLGIYIPKVCLFLILKILGKGEMFKLLSREQLVKKSFKNNRIPLDFKGQSDD